MTTCPKCGYHRQNLDDEFVPPTECPKCGIIYDKYAGTQGRVGNESESRRIDLRTEAYIAEGRMSTSWKTSILSILLAVTVIFCIKLVTREARQSNEAKFNHVQTQPQADQTQNSNLNSSIQTVNLYEKEQIIRQNRPVSPEKTYEPTIRTINKTDTELKDKIEKITENIKKPLEDSNIFGNNLPQYKWETIRKSNNYPAVRVMLRDYHTKHTYMKNDFFVCVDMAMDVWNILATMGIRAKLMVGNIDRDINEEGSIQEYLRSMNHAWVLAEISPSIWIPIETTGGYIVEPSVKNYRHYNKGTAFENPRQFKDFNSYRSSMFEAINEVPPMLDNFNRSYAGKPITAETTEYVGRMKQKLDDVNDLIQKVTGLLQQSSKS